LKGALKNKKILITCGPTWVPIDNTRVMSNISTGQLGQIFAEDFGKAGGEVTLLEGPVRFPCSSKKITIRKFSFYDELVALLREELKKKYDVIIHAAAVADYKLKKPFTQKISSTKKSLTLELIPTAKIIHLIKKWNPDVFLVGFKLESKITPELLSSKTRDLFLKAHCDLVIANAFSRGQYKGYIISEKDGILAQAGSRPEIAASLLKILKQRGCGLPPAREPIKSL